MITHVHAAKRGIGRLHSCPNSCLLGEKQKPAAGADVMFVWARSDEREPEHGQNVLALYEDGFVRATTYDAHDGLGAVCTESGQSITHWCAYPPPPGRS